MEKLVWFSKTRVVAALAVFALLASTSAFAQDMQKDKGMHKDKGMMMDAHTSGVFHGVKVNHGTVTHSRKDGKTVLTLSDDFEMPQTPDPHWQVVDSQGRVYLLDRLTAKPSGMSPEMAMNMGMKDEMGMKKGEMGMKEGMAKKDRFNKSIVLPGYVKDVVKVQIWCAWAEALLGEASFQKALK